MIPPHPFILQTWKDWGQFVGMVLIVSSLWSLLRGAYRGWRGPTNREFQWAVLMITRFMQHRNYKNPTIIKYITVHDTGKIESYLEDLKRHRHEFLVSNHESGLYCPVRGHVESCDGFDCVGAKCGLLMKEIET